jgi:hypothetical protein
LGINGIALIAVYLITTTGIIDSPFAFARTSVLFLGPFAIAGKNLKLY